jgi:hypothetical protein
MTAPSPAQFSALLDDVLSDANVARWRARLLREYTWLHGASHEAIVREREKTTGGATSDPTASIVIGSVGSVDDVVPSDAKHSPQAILRRALEEAPKDVVEIENAMKALERKLTRWHGKLDGRGILDPAPDFARAHHRSVGPDELALLREAQQRREERGEGIA